MSSTAAPCPSYQVLQRSIDPFIHTPKDRVDPLGDCPITLDDLGAFPSLASAQKVVHDAVFDLVHRLHYAGMSGRYCSMADLHTKASVTAYCYGMEVIVREFEIRDIGYGPQDMREEWETKRALSLGEDNEEDEKVVVVKMPKGDGHDVRRDTIGEPKDVIWREEMRPNWATSRGSELPSAIIVWDIVNDKGLLDQQPQHDRRSEPRQLNTMQIKKSPTDKDELRGRGRVNHASKSSNKKKAHQAKQADEVRLSGGVQGIPSEY